jgi:tellurite resistance protein
MSQDEVTEPTPDQVRAIARGLITIAGADGAIDPRERELIAELAGTGYEMLPTIAPAELAAALTSQHLGIAFLRSCYLVALADGSLSDEERGLIQGYADALRVDAAALESLAQGVKEYLLAPLSRLSNVDAVVEVAKKLDL